MRCIFNLFVGDIVYDRPYRTTIFLRVIVFVKVEIYDRRISRLTVDLQKKIAAWDQFHL